ncbi:unnamed protein product [Zymoseptoria tritici ST99CH_3D7]|uniref:Zn(2)-C6 fungal-type domain-containing protein n=1 Tax=Zymoseptoria tritici (strain ST99CH_3D7) TaxID=1276538 RepID=A0A1X7S5W9_ZYMT9|nr:unnamed protein product [Zymoseptoria tritici ST99CH_3D7]
MKRRQSRTTSNVKAACQACRASKTRCDGLRPTCSRCARRANLSCEYDTEPDEFRITALRRRYVEAEQQASTREALLRHLVDSSRDEAHDILKRMRADDSDLSILAGLLARTSNVPVGDVVEATAGNSNLDVTTNEGPLTDDRYSIAFLLARNSTARATSERMDTGSSTPRAEDPGPSDIGLGKRRRLSEVLPEVLRPILQKTLSTPYFPRQGLEPLMPKPDQTDYTWMKKLVNVKASDWGVEYATDRGFLEILKCYFTWENSVVGLVHEEAFWQGLAVGGSDWCNMCLVHSILAMGTKVYGMFHIDRVGEPERAALNEAMLLWDEQVRSPIPANISAGLVMRETLASNGEDLSGQPYLEEAMHLASRSGLFDPSRAVHMYDQTQPGQTRQRAEFAWAVYAHHGKFAARAALWRVGNSIIPLLHNISKDPGSIEVHWPETVSLFNQLETWFANLEPRMNTLHATPPHILWLHADYHRCTIDLFHPFLPIHPPTSLAHTATSHSTTQLRLLTHQIELQYPRFPIAFSALLSPVLHVATSTFPEAVALGPDGDEHFYLCLCLRLMARMAGAYPVMRGLMRGLVGQAEGSGMEVPAEVREIVRKMEKAAKGLKEGEMEERFPVLLELSELEGERSDGRGLVEQAGRLSII